MDTTISHYGKETHHTGHKVKNITGISPNLVHIPLKSKWSTTAELSNSDCRPSALVTLREAKLSYTCCRAVRIPSIEWRERWQLQLQHWWLQLRSISTVNSHAQLTTLLTCRLTTTIHQPPTWILPYGWCFGANRAELCKRGSFASWQMKHGETSQSILSTMLANQMQQCGSKTCHISNNPQSILEA